VAVLPFSASGRSTADQDAARELEWCLPGELVRDGVKAMAPEKLMTLTAQTHGAYDRASARALGLAAGARFVVYGNVAGGTANLFVSAVLDDRSVYADSFVVGGDARARCVAFAAGAAARLATEPVPLR